MKFCFTSAKFALKSISKLPISDKLVENLMSPVDPL